MYRPVCQRLDDIGAQHALIEANALGAWVCVQPEGLQAHHLPWLLDRSRGAFGTLMGHVSRANPVWRGLARGQPSVVMFRGAQAYITPSWYPGKVEHGRVVPTWNYAAVNAHGQARAIDDPVWLRAMLDRLTDAHEHGRAAPWRVADAPRDHIDALMRGVVGIEITIERLEGRLKASQDEAPEDRRGTVEGLIAQGGEQALLVADMVGMAVVDSGRVPGPGGREPR